jgi:Putative Flp pilus-assembly TadE/G-like
MPKLSGLRNFLGGTVRNPKLTDDRGAIMPLFAIILGSGVFMMLIGLVVDGGQIYAEKRLVQNAADAVAEAVALHCSKDTVGVNCLIDNFETKSPTTAAVTASMTFADFTNALANPKGGNTAITNICGQSTTATGIPACPPLTASPNDCKTEMATAGFTNWVRVYSSSDLNGITPAFENFINPTPKKYQETACSQVYWAKANAINVDATGGQLPFAIGLCDATVFNSAARQQLIGDDTNVTSCSVRDRQNTAFAANTHGFIDFDPGAATANCWSLLTGGCTKVALTTVRSRTGISYSPASYKGLIASMNTNLNKPALVPVIDSSGAGYTVVSFVSFTLLGYKMPTVTGTNAITASTANSYPGQPGAINYTWTGTCAAAQSTTSPFCIVGTFNSRVAAPSGRTPGLTYTTNANVPDLGYQVVRHLR